MIKTKQTVVVMGGFKGGTSSIAGALSVLGVHMGDEITHRGEYEDTDVIDATVDEIKAIIEKRNREHEVWGWKYFALDRYIESVKKYLINPKYVIVIRDVYATALSQLSRCKTPHYIALARAADEASSNYRFMMNNLNSANCIPISFEHLIRSPENVICGLVKSLNIDVSPILIQKAINFIQVGNYQHFVIRGQKAKLLS